LLGGINYVSVSASIVSGVGPVRSILILKCFHSRDHCVLKLAFCTHVTPLLLEFSSQVWSPHHRYMIDKIESVQRFFTKKLSGLQNLTYLQRLKVLGLKSLERRRLIFDLVLCYKIIQGLLQHHFRV